MVQNVKLTKKLHMIFANTAFHLELTISLVFSKNALFHSAWLPKTRNSTASLNTLYTAESAQLYSEFLPTTISLTGRCRRKHGVSLCFLAKDTQYDPKMRGYEDNAKFPCAFSVTACSYAMRFLWKWSDRKFWISGQIFKKIFENVTYTVFVIC